MGQPKFIFFYTLFLSVINNGFLISYQNIRHSNNIPAITGASGTFTPVIVATWAYTVSCTSHSAVMSKCLMTGTYECYNTKNTVANAPIHIRLITIGY